MRLLKLLPLLSLATILGVTASAQSASKPKLVVEIVISQMRYDYPDRLYGNLTDRGLRTFIDKGVNFSEARYDYMLTNTVAGLATLSTGANPSTHGITSTRWSNFTTNEIVDLIEDSQVYGLESESGAECYSPKQLIAGTLGDRLKESNPEAKVISIASTPTSAIVLGGFSADTYWIGTQNGRWISSSYYFEELPKWVRTYNETEPAKNYMSSSWEASKPSTSYLSQEHTIINFEKNTRFLSRDFFHKSFSFLERDTTRFDIQALLATPYGNSLVTQFARQAIFREELGKDEHTDLLTICYDAPRIISEYFGPRSIELEDMYYKLDEELAELLTLLEVQLPSQELVVVLTSDHGSSDTFNKQSRIPMGQFNTHQYKMILNGFLSAQYEPGNWVVDYTDNQVYLNRELIYQYGYDLAEFQNRAASFTMQFRGISAVLTSTRMQRGGFSEGYGAKMQNSFYPKRSGDLTLCLMPGWIEERPSVVASSGSLYEYDTHVPLFFYGGGLAAQRNQSYTDMTSVAPTLARLMGITLPNAATGRILQEICTPNE